METIIQNEINKFIQRNSLTFSEESILDSLNKYKETIIRSKKKLFLRYIKSEHNKMNYFIFYKKINTHTNFTTLYSYMFIKNYLMPEIVWINGLIKKANKELKKYEVLLEEYKKENHIKIGITRMHMFIEITSIKRYTYFYNLFKNLINE